MTGFKGAMYRRLSGLKTGTAFGTFPWQRDATCARKFSLSSSLASSDVIFLESSAEHCK